MVDRRFVIGVVGRSGTTRYAYLINAALLQEERYRNLIWFANSTHELNLYYHINHTHNLENFLSAPSNLEKIWARRNYLDILVSNFVGIQTQVYYVDWQNSARYANNFQNQKFHINVDTLFNDLTGLEIMSAQLKQAMQNSTNTTWHELSFNLHAVNPVLFFETLGLPHTPQYYGPDPMSIDKYSLIDNLDEIIELYQSYNFQHDVDKQETIDRLKAR